MSGYSNHNFTLNQYSPPIFEQCKEAIDRSFAHILANKISDLTVAQRVEEGKWLVCSVHNGETSFCLCDTISKTIKTSCDDMDFADARYMAALQKLPDRVDQFCNLYNKGIPVPQNGAINEILEANRNQTRTEYSSRLEDLVKQAVELRDKELKLRYDMERDKPNRFKDTGERER